jgi:predicted transcriptional regulator
MSDKELAKQRAEALKALKVEHNETFQRTQENLKEQQGLRKLLKTALKNDAKTIPQIASAASLPTDQVLWHITAMKKYDLVTEVGQEGEYYQYELSEVKK